MACKYFVRDGVPSKLFDSLFEVFKKRYNGDEVLAEKEAVRIWSMTRSDNFKQWFGDWETEANANNPKLLEESKNLIKSDIKGAYAIHFADNIKESLRNVAEQFNSGNANEVVQTFGERIKDIALKLYPNVKMGDPRDFSKIIDDNGEPLLINDEFNNGKEKRLIDNIGYFRTDADNIYAMAADQYYDTQAKNKPGNFFSLNYYNPSLLEDGKKNMSIRPENLKSGTYRYGNNYYKIINRGLKRVSELKENKDAIRARSIEQEDKRDAHVEAFYNNRLPMYVYDIKKMGEADGDKFAMAADFHGDITIKRSSNAFASNGDVFNKYISAVSDYISRLKDERTKNKGNLKVVQEYNERIEEQEAILKSLENNKSVRFLIETGIQQLDDIKRYSMKDNASLIELTEGMRITLAWSQINQVVDLMKEGKSESELELIDTARSLQSEADTMFSVLSNNHTKKVLALAEEYDIEFGKEKGAWIDENGDLRMRDLGKLSVNTISSAYSSNPLETLMVTLLAARNNASNEEHYSFLSDADNTTRRLLGNKHANTDFMTEEFETEYVNPDTGQVSKVKRQGIVTEFSRKFYDEYNEMRSKAIRGEIKWKKFYEFEQKHFDYRLTEEGKKEYEKYIESVKPDYVIDIDEDGKEVYDEAALNAVIKKYDPAGFQAHLDDADVDANSGGRWFTKIPRNIPINPNYAKLTDQQKEYHKWFSDQYMDAYINSIFDYRVGQTDIDQLLMDFSTTLTEGLSSKAKYIGQAGIDFLKNSFTVVASGTKSSAVTRALTGREHITTVFKPIDGFLPENGKINPLEVLKKFKAASIAFKHKREIEEVLNVINDIASTATRQEQNNAQWDINRNTGGGMGTKSPLNIASRIEYSVKEYLLGTGKDANTTHKNVTPGERGFSVEQTFDTVNKFTRFRYMALSPLSATGNFLMGAMNNLIYASTGEYFTDKELARASFMLKGAPFSFFSKNATLDKVDLQTKEAKLVAELMYKYNILGDVTEELTYGGQALARFFALQKGGEFLVQGATCLAQMLHTKIDFKDGSKKTLLDLYKLNDENRLVFQEDLLPEDSEWRNIENVHKFFDKVKAVNDRIHGDYRNALAGKKTVFGRMLFLFRTWLPMSVKERFGAEYEHKLLGLHKGRYRSLAALSGFKRDEDGHIQFDKDSALNLAKTFIKMIPFAGRFVKLGGNISEIDRKNIDMFVRETQLLIMLYMACAFCKLQMSDDDDDDEVNYLKYLYNQGERMQSELSMYYQPSSFTQIIKNIIPLYSTLSDTEKVLEAMHNYVTSPEKDTYSRGFRKGDSKVVTKIEQFLPLSRSAQSTWSAFSNLYNQNSR